MAQWELRSKKGVALLALDTDGLIAQFTPTIGVDTTITGSLLDPHSTAAGELDWGRSITATLTDADASITQMKVYLTGTDTYDAVIQETLTLVAAGTVESSAAFASLTAVIYHADGVAGGADKLEVGWGDKLGSPLSTLAAAAEIRTKRVGAVIDAGTINTTFKTWEPTGGNLPDAAKLFFFETW
jgi:hypothetical protein